MILWPFKTKQYLVIVAFRYLKQTRLVTSGNFVCLFVFVSHLKILWEMPAFLNSDYCFHFTSSSACIFSFQFVWHLLTPPRPQRTEPVLSLLLTLTEILFILLGTGLLLVVGLQWEFFHLCFAVKLLSKGKTRPWGRRLQCNFSVNIHLHFYTNQVSTEIILLLWAFFTIVPVNELPGKNSYKEQLSSE